MTASDPATDPAQRGIFLVRRSHISPCDKTAHFPTIPDTETVQRIGCKAPPRLARQRADTPDESHMFSAQVRRGLNRAPRGGHGGSGVYAPPRGVRQCLPGTDSGPPRAAKRAVKGVRPTGVHARYRPLKSLG
jgi:hypothetical protein